jgi:hypothetical protein
MKSYEDRSEFLYTLDLDTGKVAHVKRIVSALDPAETERTGLTGIEVIDDHIATNSPQEHASLEDIKRHHGVSDFSKYLNITTNQNTKRAERDFLNKPYVLISYKAVFQLIIQRGVQDLFAYMNKKAVDSLEGGLGVTHDLVAGKELHLPMPDDPTQFDADYIAVCIPNTEKNRAAFTEVNPDYPGTSLIADREVPLITR